MRPALDFKLVQGSTRPPRFGAARGVLLVSLMSATLCGQEVASAALGCRGADGARLFSAAPSLGRGPQRPVSPDPSERRKEEKGNAPGRGGGRQQHRSAPKPPARPAQLEVSFKTNVGDAELFLSSGAEPARRIGVTDAAGAFKLMLAPGVYEVTAARRGFLRDLRRVDVRPDNTNFNFTLSAEPEPPAPALRARVVVTTDDVIRRYVDPRQTEGVTLEDWESVRKQAGEAFEANLANVQARAQALFAEGQLALLRGRYADALVAFNNAGQTLPGSALAFYGLGRTYLATSHTEQAVLSFMRALQLNEEMALAHAGMFEALTLQGRDVEARRFFERAGALGYDTSILSLIRARELMRRERWAEALEELRAAALKRQSADLNIAVGDCYIGLKQLFSAGPAYERAVELNPKSAVAHARLGEVRLRQKDYARAHESLERALQLDPTGVTINRERVAKLSREAATRARKMK